MSSTDVPGFGRLPGEIYRKLVEYIGVGKHYGLIHYTSRDRAGRITYDTWSFNVLTLGFQVAALLGVFGVVTPYPTATKTSYRYLNAYIGTGLGTPSMGDTELAIPLAAITLNDVSGAGLLEVGAQGTQFIKGINGRVRLEMPNSVYARRLTEYRLAVLSIDIQFGASVFGNTETVSEFAIGWSNTKYVEATNITSMPSGFLIDHDIIEGPVTVKKGGELGITAVFGV